jgi:hypothetical protein
MRLPLAIKNVAEVRKFSITGQFQYHVELWIKCSCSNEQFQLRKWKQFASTKEKT